MASTLLDGQLSYWAEEVSRTSRDGTICRSRWFVASKKKDGQRRITLYITRTGRQINVMEYRSLSVKEAHGHEQFNEGLRRLDRRSIASLLQGDIGLTEGKLIHADIARRGLERDTLLASRLVNLYGKSGALDDARSLFDKMLQRNGFSWNAMIAAYAQHGHGKEALQLFGQMQQEGVKPNKITLISILGACASMEALAAGEVIHACVVQCGLESDVVVGNALITMYGKCGSLEVARSVFDNMHQRNVVSWNAMIAAYAQHGHGKKALQLFQQMQKEGVKPSKITFISILGACDTSAALSEGKMIHACVTRYGFESDVVVATALVSMYGECESLEDARAVFDKMHLRDVISWNAMITACVQDGHGKEALQLFRKMQQEGLKPNKITFISVLSACDNLAALPDGRVIHACIVDRGFDSDVVVGTTLMNMYGKCGSLKDAQTVFNKMHKRDVISWNAMITVYLQHGHGKEALQLFQHMQQEGVKPSKITFISALGACASLAALAEGEMIHGCIVDRGFESDAVVGNALVNMYAKCGSLGNAHSVFDKMHYRDVVSWNAMISAHGQLGDGKGALQVFRQMQQDGVKADKFTFLNLLSACSHAGLLDEGCCCFVSMSEDHGIMPTVEHFNCMIDLYGRAGLLDKAEDFIHKMPLQPNASVWMTLLGACRIHGDMERGKRAAEHLLEFDPQIAAPYVLLSNIYSAYGR